MATTATQQAPATDVATIGNTGDVDVTYTLTGDLKALKSAYDKATGDFNRAKEQEETAAHAKHVATVWMARVAYRTASHEDVATSRYPYNITGAAKALGIPVATLRPYALAGMALHKKDLAGLLSVPSAEDIAVVEKSFDDTTRAQQKEKRVKEAAKKAALEAKARELEALKAAQAPEGAKAPEAPVAGDKAPEAPAQAPAQAPAPSAPEAPAQAPAGPSLQDDALAVAKDLVRKVKALKAAGDKATILKVNAILAEVYPALKA